MRLLSLHMLHEENTNLIEPVLLAFEARSLTFGITMHTVHARTSCEIINAAYKDPDSFIIIGGHDDLDRVNYYRNRHGLNSLSWAEFYEFNNE